MSEPTATGLNRLKQSSGNYGRQIDNLKGQIDGLNKLAEQKTKDMEGIVEAKKIIDEQISKLPQPKAKSAARA